MFGNTLAVFGSALVSERSRNPDLYAYLASEYRPADRESIVSALRHEAVTGRRRRALTRPTLFGRIGAWVRTAIVSA